MPLSPQLISPHANRESCSPGNGHHPDFKCPKANLGKFLDRAMRALLSDWGSNSKGKLSEGGTSIGVPPSANPCKPCFEAGRKGRNRKRRSYHVRQPAPPALLPVPRPPR